MKNSVRIVFKSVKVKVHLEPTPTAEKLLQALPCESRVETWGEEIYFKVPIQAKLEEGAKQVVDPGTICFWVEGQSLALPFGPTPISQGRECRLVTRVNLLGKMEGDPKILKSVREGEKVRVERG